MPGAESSGIVLFAAELKAQRTRLGWTQAELGDKIGFSGSFVSDVERSERTPRIDFARACDREMGLPGSLERMHELVRNAAYPSFFAPVVPFEREAVRIHGFELGSVPGLLQTETYARALIRATRPHDKDADIERLVAARLERQEIMSKDSPPLLWYVLDESVLRRVVGSDGPISVYEFSGAPSVLHRVQPGRASDRGSRGGSRDDDQGQYDPGLRTVAACICRSDARDQESAR
jgi:transcriptional regulator with XRE-family HTH domain